MIEPVLSALHEWMALPLAALDGPLSALVLFVFGMVHVTLPGHGKVLLAARHAQGRSGTVAGQPAVAVLDAFSFAGARALVAFCLVAGAIYAARAFGIEIPIRALRMVAGAALVGIGLHLAAHSFTNDARNAAQSAPLPRRQLDRSILLMALTPEPVALAIASFGYARLDLKTAALAILCLALGMGTTLSVTSLIAGRRSGRLVKLFLWSGGVVGFVLAAAGALVIAEAW